MKIAIGSPIPDFSMLDQNETIVSNTSLKGQKYILFFYPKDDSPSCTKEACSLRDHYRSINNKGYKIFGISPDTVKKHRKFIDKYEFQYDLLSDDKLETLTNFGLYGPKKFMGKDIVGVYRTTVIVNAEGLITHIVTEVKTAQHGEQVLELIS